jgi:hypothetical protein
MSEADNRLAAAADRHLSNNPEGQLVQLLLEWIAEEEPGWFTPNTQRDLWPMEVRFEWLLSRPDVRGRVVHAVTGVSEGAARLLDPDVQIALVDAVLDNGDVSVATWAAAFQPHELAAHAPPAAIHSEVRQCFPWQAPPSQDRRDFLLRWLEAVQSTGDGNGRSRQPILSPLAFRSAVNTQAWQASVPLELRAAVDGARLHAEGMGLPFTAEDELVIVTTKALVDNVPYVALRPVLEAAERALASELDGFGHASVNAADGGAQDANAASNAGDVGDEEVTQAHDLAHLEEARRAIGAGYDGDRYDDTIIEEPYHDDDDEPSVEIIRADQTEEVPRA